MKIIKKALFGALFAAATVFSGVAAADSFPDQTIKVVAPYAPGGASDMFARALAEGLRKEFDIAVVVENRAGASGIIGAEYVSRAKPDGYTLVVGAVSLHSILPSLIKKMGEVQENLTPVSTIANSPSYVVVPADSPATDIVEFVEMLQANPDDFMYGSAGNGTSQHLFAELFKQEIDADILHVPYKGSGELVVDLIAGRVDFAVEQGPAILSHVHNGKLRVLATAMAERTDEMPDVPTLAETVLPGFAANTWFAVYAPKGTPESAINTLNAAFENVLQDEDVVKVLRSQGAIPLHMTAAELAEMEERDRQMWLEVIESGQIVLENN